MYDFDEFDDEYDDDIDDLEDEEDELLEREDELMEEEDELREREDEIRETEDVLREAAEDIHEDLRVEIEDQLGELEGSRGDIESLRHELEEIRRMKEQLRHEIEDVRREKDVRMIERRTHRVARPPRPPRPQRPAKVPRAPHRAAIVDFEALTDSLEDMMDGLGDQIRLSVSGLKDIDKEFVKPFLKTTTRRVKHGKSRAKSKIDTIPPERVANVITPLASEERLKILDFLKGGGKTFKELEDYIGKFGSSLTHHLNPLLEAGYVIKGEVRGTYYLTVEGRLAYRLAQWLTDRLEREIRLKDVKEEKLKPSQSDHDGEVEVIVEDAEEDEQ